MNSLHDSTNPIRREKLALASRALWVRLRFVAVLAAAFLVVGNWEVIVNRLETFTRGFVGRPERTDLEVVSTDIEYFCPMDPGVISNWPSQCGICNMALVRRKKGEPSLRPDGVIARMQFSPYRVQLAGLKTVPVQYLPLELESRRLGSIVESRDGVARVSLDIAGRERLNGDDRLEVLGPGAVEDQTPHSAKLARDEAGKPVGIEIVSPPAEWVTGSRVIVVARSTVADQEPFRSMPVNPPPLSKQDIRQLHRCPDHPSTLFESAGICPLDAKRLEPVRLLDNQRVAWWCPAHPEVRSDKKGGTCERCGGMKLSPRIVTYRPTGKVPAIPESSVIATGTRSVVYVERMPGMFDAVEVQLGPRAGPYYPLISGLELGERVATSGAFLLDAETRLNPSVAASYFGATSQGIAHSGTAGPVADPLAEYALSPEDLALATRQAKQCPVTKKPLGSMGAPIRVELGGRSALICCEGCRARLTKNPDRYLSQSR